MRLNRTGGERVKTLFCKRVIRHISSVMTYAERALPMLFMQAEERENIPLRISLLPLKT